MNPRLTLYLLGFCAAVVSLAQNLYVPLLPSLQDDLHTSFYLVNLTVSFFTIALAVMQIAFGPIIDKKGRRAVLLPSMLLYALASVGCAFSPTVYVLLFFRLLQGIGAAAVPLVAATVIGDIFTGKERAKGMSTYQMILGIAPAFGPLIGGFIGSFAGYFGTFLFLAVLALVMLLTTALALPETKPAAGIGASAGAHSYASLLKNRAAAPVLLLGFALYYIFYNFLVFLPDLLTHSYNLDMKQIGWVFLLLLSFSMIGNKVSGKWQGAIGTTKSLFATSGLTLLSLALFLLTAKASLALLLVTLVIVGFAAGLTMSVPPTLLTEEFPNQRATAIGLYNFVRYLGMAAAPLLGSPLYLAGDVWLLFGFAFLLLLFTIWFAKRRLQDKAVSKQSSGDL